MSATKNESPEELVDLLGGGAEQDLRERLSALAVNNIKRQAPSIDEKLITKISDAVRQNPHNNSTLYTLGWMFNNNLVHIPKKYPELQQKYLLIALYYFKNYRIEDKVDDPVNKALSGLGGICNYLISQYKVFGEEYSGVCKEVAAEALDIYYHATIKLGKRVKRLSESEGERDKKKQELLLNTCRVMIAISLRATELYDALSSYIRASNDKGREKIGMLKKIQPQESEIRKPEMIRGIWEYVKKEYLAKSS